VVTCLHGGLVPIVSRESGVDVESFGTVLESCSLEEIKDAVRMVASLPVRELRERARGAWEYARAHHTREKFAEEYRQAVSRILSQPRQSSPT
jgi:glycosyltransferase involved in cell wall biosynthesis